MSDRTCPRCAGPLTTGADDGAISDPATATAPRTAGAPDTPALPLTCPACGWSSADDRPGSLGGDNGGA